jgi:hypothetical protein
VATGLKDAVQFPWINASIPVDLTYTHLTGEEHRALGNMAKWSQGLQNSIERACFANYLEKVEAIGAEPPTVPVIKRPGDVWKHIQIKSVRPQGADLVVVYVEPSWDDTLHLEWCIQGTDRLLYVGQVLCYPADGYEGIKSGNNARNCEETIVRLGHLPQRWTSDT